MNNLEHLSDSELNALLPVHELSDVNFAETEFSLRMACLIHGVSRDAVRPYFELKARLLKTKLD